MTRNIPSSFQEIKEVVVRRWVWIVVTLLVIPPIVYTAGHYWPKRYRSETTILVDPQRVPEQYVKATVTGDITDRLQTIKEEVMSRTRLLMIAENNHLYVQKGKPIKEADLLASMRKDISVDIIHGASDRNPIDGFKIAYIAPTPELAQDITRQIAGLFIEENVKQRDQDAQGTQRFIEAQLTQARSALDAQEQKISQFKAAHLGTLPSQEAANLTMISEYQGLAQTNSEAIDRANQQKIYLESMLNVSGGGKVTAIAPAPTALQLRLQTAENQLAAARQKYTEVYPDVVRLRDEVASLKAQVKAQPANGSRPATSTGPNVDQQLQGQLLATEQEIKSRTARQAKLESEIGTLQSRVRSLPEVQQDFEALSRDYSEMQKNYESLLEKEQSSSMAAELERHNESERFRVLDPASYPAAPYSPNLLLVNAMGILGALVLGFCLAFLAEMRDQTIHSADDAELYLSAPLMITLPSIKLQNAEQSRKGNALSIASET